MPRTTDAASSPRATLCSADMVCGWDVVGSGNRLLGTVSTLLFDLATGRIACAVVASGGFMGVGETRYTIPWHKLAARNDGSRCFECSDSRFSDEQIVKPAAAPR